MTTTKKHQVVMLPTNEKAQIGDNVIVKHNATLAFGKKVQEPYNMGEENQHLYILSDEEIKESGWYENNGVIFRADDKFDEGNNPNQNKKNKKIIATTDKSLGYTDHRVSPVPNFCDYPQPSQSFIELYVNEYNKGNIITEVMVEYEIEGEVGEMFAPELKINPDNTINISVTNTIVSKFSKELDLAVKHWPLKTTAEDPAVRKFAEIAALAGLEERDIAEFCDMISEIQDEAFHRGILATKRSQI